MFEKSTVQYLLDKHFYIREMLNVDFHLIKLVYIFASCRKLLSNTGAVQLLAGHQLKPCVQSMPHKHSGAGFLPISQYPGV